MSIYKHIIANSGLKTRCDIQVCHIKKAGCSSAQHQSRQPSKESMSYHASPDMVVKTLTIKRILFLFDLLDY